MLALLFVAACQDLQRQQAPTETPPVLSTTGTTDVLVEDVVGENASTLCHAYGTRLAAYQAALAQNRRNQELQEKVETYQTIVADACGD
jgi:hypothetical protein